MILFTGGGSLAIAFKKKYDCEIISARKLTDEQLKNTLKNAKIIFHNAALVNSTDLNSLIASNFVLTKRIIDLAAEVNPSVNFINISSMSFLGLNGDIDAMHSMSPYAISKYMAEVYCLNHKIRTTSIRFSTIFYGNPIKDGLSKLAYEAVIKGSVDIFNNGDAKRDFIPIEIVVEYLNKLTTILHLPAVINIVSGKPTQFKEFIEHVRILNPNIVVNNIDGFTKEVLSDFSKRDIVLLGEIEFSIFDFFTKYVNKLYEDFNL